MWDLVVDFAAVPPRPLGQCKVGTAGATALEDSLWVELRVWLDFNPIQNVVLCFCFFLVFYWGPGTTANSLPAMQAAPFLQSSLICFIISTQTCVLLFLLIFFLSLFQHPAAAFPNEKEWLGCAGLAGHSGRYLCVRVSALSFTSLPSFRACRLIRTAVPSGLIGHKS